jgi:hypothetical protein
MVQRKRLHAVYDDDLEGFLQRLGLLDALATGDLRCEFSHDVITRDNLYCIFPENDEVKFSCNRPECIQKVMMLVSRGAIGG